MPPWVRHQPTNPSWGSPLAMSPPLLASLALKQLYFVILCLAEYSLGQYSIRSIKAAH